MSGVYPIPQHIADEAINEAGKRIRQSREKAAACKRLAASPLAGRVVNVSIAPQLEALFPEYIVRYSASDNQRKHKGVYLVTDRGENKPRESLYIPLADIEQKRISKDALLKLAEESVREAQRYEQALSDFPSLLAQYNNVVPYVKELRSQLSTLMFLTHYGYNSF